MTPQELAEQISKAMGGTVPGYGSATSIYFTFEAAGEWFEVRVSNHVATPWRQNGHYRSIDICDTMSVDAALSHVRSFVADVVKVKEGRLAPFAIKVGDTVRHGYGHLKVQAVNADKRAYLVHVPGVGQKWFVDQTPE